MLYDLMKFQQNAKIKNRTVGSKIIKEKLTNVTFKIYRET